MSVITNLLSCWGPAELPELSLPSQESQEVGEGFFEPCEAHGNEITFICKRFQCRDDSNCMLCKDCLIDHKSHDWITKEEFLTPNIRNILMFQEAETDIILQNTLRRLMEHISAMEEDIKKQFVLIRHHLEKSVVMIEEKYRFHVDRALVRGHVILNKMKMEKLLSIFEVEQSRFEWIRVMQQGIKKIGDKIGESIRFLLQDMINISNAEKWEEREHHVDEFREFEKHLHEHLRSDNRYYRFSSVDKHMNIKLSKEMDEAFYSRSVPSKPLVIASEYISQVHNKFGFEIMKMNSKAIFFDATTVFLGVCSANVVKSFGYRKVNEFGKGSYMISSQGWAYHSTNEEYNNKEIVGWGFGQGDTILVEIIFNTDCVIRFTKKSRFFNNVFEMPLKLNEFQMNRLKPCLGFDSQEGAVVRIFDVFDEVAPAQPEERISTSRYNDSVLYF